MHTISIQLHCVEFPTALKEETHTLKTCVYAVWAFVLETNLCPLPYR